MTERKIDTICDRCGRQLDLDEAIDGPNGMLCDDCACAVSEEEDEHS